MAWSKAKRVENAVRTLCREWYVPGVLVKHTIVVDGTRPRPEGRVRKAEDEEEEYVYTPPEPEPERTEEQILADEYAKDAQWREDNGLAAQSYEKWLVHWNTMNG